MRNTASTNKIIFFVVFTCTALITSLFVFHASHKNKVVPLANENRMIFPVARDIKNFELVATNGKKLSPAVFLHHWTLLFFGFTHCSSVCPTTLDMLARAYTKLHIIYPNLQVIFVSLDPNRDDINTLTTYMRGFHTDFIAATGKIQEIRKLQSQLGIYSAHVANSDQIQHTPSILLINPEGKWSGLLKPTMSPDQFVATFTSSIQLVK